MSLPWRVKSEKAILEQTTGNDVFIARIHSLNNFQNRSYSDRTTDEAAEGD